VTRASPYRPRDRRLDELWYDTAADLCRPIPPPSHDRLTRNAKARFNLPDHLVRHGVRPAERVDYERNKRDPKGRCRRSGRRHWMDRQRGVRNERGRTLHLEFEHWPCGLRRTALSVDGHWPCQNAANSQAPDDVEPCHETGVGSVSCFNPTPASCPSWSDFASSPFRTRTRTPTREVSRARERAVAELKPRAVRAPSGRSGKTPRSIDGPTLG
jgi:hypothetical protein